MSMVDKNRSRYGGYIVHIGILLMFIGFAGKAFTVEKDVSLRVGESQELGSYTFTLDNFSTQERPTHTAFVANLSVSMIRMTFHIRSMFFFSWMITECR